MKKKILLYVPVIKLIVVEAVVLTLFNYTFEITIFVSGVKFGANYDKQLMYDNCALF